LILLASRDLAATATGASFRPLAARIGVTGAVTGCALCSASGLVVLAMSGLHTLPLMAAGTALQGVALALAIASTNLLATAGQGDKGLRLAATQYLNAGGSIILPVAFGFALQLSGARGLFFLGAAIAGGLAGTSALLLRLPGPERGATA
jgi:hypothetical protein